MTLPVDSEVRSRQPFKIENILVIQCKFVGIGLPVYLAIDYVSNNPVVSDHI